ncbi:hypothetical protein NQ317_000882 [Molorchus minor]|uniref:ENTH domain-containing protein n=1 Tax=Molorchus minor TaxID=1323400 RepID=A0ABQ9JVN7_9CUCU|nr:hypothetical protein NQ317_000882 [Molorchus minor]
MTRHNISKQYYKLDIHLHYLPQCITSSVGRSQALQKAINGQETPIKQKHVRSAIIGTFHTQSAKTFWAYALRLPAMDDRIVAWKLCHVVHKILREGHPLCLVDSQRHRKDLDEIGEAMGSS